MYTYIWASQVALVVKNPPANAGDVRDACLIPGLGRSPGGGNSIPLQYSCLENPMDRGSWRTTVHRVAKIWTWLKQLNTYAYIHTYIHICTYPMTQQLQSSAFIPNKWKLCCCCLLAKWVAISSSRGLTSTRMFIIVLFIINQPL